MVVVAVVVEVPAVDPLLGVVVDVVVLVVLPVEPLPVEVVVVVAVVVLVVELPPLVPPEDEPPEVFVFWLVEIVGAQALGDTLMIPLAICKHVGWPVTES